MKTTLIQVDENDDILSIKDKMQWNPSRRVLLIVPHNNNSIHRRIDLILLQRTAKNLGAQLAISTSQKYLQGLGKLTNVQVFSTVLAAQKQVWLDHTSMSRDHASRLRQRMEIIKEFSADKKRERSLPGWQKILFFTLGVLAFISLILVLFTHATITLYPKQSNQGIRIQFSASPAFSMETLVGKIPASIREVTLSVSDAISTTGETTIPVHFATGMIRVINLTENEQFLPAHLRINSDSPNLQFQTLAENVVPAGKRQFADIPISALVAGTQGNLPPLSINVVSEPFGSWLQVTNLISTVGGSEIQVNAVSEKDYQLLKSQMSQELWSKVYSQIKDQSSSTEWVVTESIKLLNETSTANLEIGDPGDKLIMKTTGTFQYMTVVQDDINQITSALAGFSVPSGYEQVAGSLQLGNPEITSFDMDNQVVNGQIELTQMIQVATDNNNIVSNILGKTKKQAMHILESNNAMQQTPAIVLSPSFWIWIPLVPGQITLDYSGVP